MEEAFQCDGTGDPIAPSTLFLDKRTDLFVVEEGSDLSDGVRRCEALGGEVFVPRDEQEVFHLKAAASNTFKMTWNKHVLSRFALPEIVSSSQGSNFYTMLPFALSRREPCGGGPECLDPETIFDWSGEPIK